MTTPTPAVYIGLDVGKTDHHAVALTESPRVWWRL